MFDKRSNSTDEKRVANADTINCHKVRCHYNDSFDRGRQPPGKRYAHLPTPSSAHILTAKSKQFGHWSGLQSSTCTPPKTGAFAVVLLFASIRPTGCRIGREELSICIERRQHVACWSRAFEHAAYMETPIQRAVIRQSSTNHHLHFEPV